MSIKRIAGVVLAGTALAVLPAAAASAVPAPSGAAPKVATPAQACGLIASTIAGLPGSEDFSYSGCVRGLAAKKDMATAGFLAGASQQCATYEQGVTEGSMTFKITYPYAFYADAPEGEGFPGLVARDRADCARALYAFHTIGSYLFGEE